MLNEEQYADIKGQLMANVKEHESYNRRLKEHDEHLDKLDNTYVLLERLTNAVNSLTSGMADLKTVVQSMDGRVAQLEREPADKWKKVMWEIIKAILLAVVGVVIGRFTKGA